VSVVGIVLAAGAGRRFGEPKAEVILDGERLLDRAVRVLREGGCADVLAVVRAGTLVVGARAVVNDGPERGLASSLALGLQAAANTSASHAVVMLVDMPGVQPTTVAAVGGATAPITMAGYAGRRGHPVAFARELWGDVAETVHGDEGARTYIDAHPDLVSVVEVGGGPQALADIDTPADLAHWTDHG
jgi:CTP:molybdopterin cytidylyltransferase MocA